MPQGYVPGRPKGYDTFLPQEPRFRGRSFIGPAPSNPEQIPPDKPRRRIARKPQRPATRKGGR